MALELGLNRDAALLGPPGREGQGHRGGRRAVRGRARGGEGDPAQGHRVFCQGDESLSCRFRFVSAHSSSELPDDQRHAVTRLCEAVEVKRGSYYTWRAAEPARAAKAADDAALTCRIREIHQDSRCTYWAKRVALDLAGQGAGPVNHKKVARLIRQAGIEGRHERRRRCLTRQDKTAPPAPDPLGRNFEADTPDAKWCGDIAYIPTGESGFLHVATVIDLFSGRLIGWWIADHHRAELVRELLPPLWSPAAATCQG
jgi:transposase InsO family protein